MKKLISILLALALLVSCIAALAEAEPEEYACREENFSTRIPAGTSAAYEEGTGLMIYARSEGNIPYVIVSRRPLDMKFQNPENYLNNVFREYMEDKYGDKFRGMNPAKTWEAGGKELLGARYMYMVGDVQVTLLRLVEVRNGGDVEYTAKYTGDTEEITMAALDTAVRYYRETDNETPEKPEVTEIPAPSGTVPAFMIPSEFVTRFNGAMEALADQYADQLGEETARALKDSYTITEKDPQNQIVYYGTKDWQIEVAFYYPDDNEPEDTTVARIMNFAIRNDTPEMAANISRRIFEMLIAYEFQNEVSADALHNWFETVNSPEDTFQIPGYTVNAVFPEGYTQYAILPADADIPEGTPDIPVENEPPESPAGTAAQDDGEWMDFHCEEDGFTTRKPYHALTQYKNDKGYVGIAFYLDVPGFPPYVLIHRRPMEGKFKNPEGYLNNTYREFLEDKFAGSSVATNPAKTWEIGGKQLIGAKYTIRDEYGETIQLQLIEVRELGDVEYTAMYSSAEEEALVMKALEAAVANYAEDEAKETAAASLGTAPAGNTAGHLPGLEEIRAKLESGEKIGSMTYRDANYSDIFFLDDLYMPEYIGSLWEALSEVTVGEPVEVSGDVPRTHMDIWVDGHECWFGFGENFAEDSDGKCYRLEDDSRFREVLKTVTDQMLTIVWLEYRPVILGKTTPAELTEDGWDFSFEEDGTIAISFDYRDGGAVYLTTEHASVNRPIMKINAMWADEYNIEYCGFDGAINPGLAEGVDHDANWNREYPFEVLVTAWERDDIYIDPWGAMCNWLVDECGAKLNEEGVYEAEVKLNDGRTVYIQSHDSAPCVSLIGY